MIDAKAVSRAIDECDAVHDIDVVVGDDGVMERIEGWVTKTSELLCKVVQNVRRSESRES